MDSAQLGSFVGSLTMIYIMSVMYFLPSLVSRNRKTAFTKGILIINILLGWTILGWIGALVWAVSAQRNARDETV